jgi:(5-formylfuran-3-yl)methyl phosphate synthase
VTRLLVSVRSAAEARLALAGGADLIDVKEPQLGSLGAAAPQVWTSVADAVCGARPLSAALGDLTLLRGYDYAKLGLAGCGSLPDWPARWQAALAALPQDVAPVAVAYADYQTAQAPRPDEVCAVGRRLGCRALLLDTYEKACGDLFDVLPAPALRDVCQTARTCSMILVLAGSLTLRRLDEALRLAPDYLALRGAVCRGRRDEQLDADLVRIWSRQLAHSSETPARRWTDGQIQCENGG